MTLSNAQNTGIGTTNPSERLEVQGIIFSNVGGFKFPDSTLQTTAAYNTSPANAADTGRLFAIMEILGTNDVDGPLNDYGYTDAFEVFDLNVETKILSGISAAIEDISLLKDIDIGTPVFYERLSSGQSIEFVLIHLMKTGMSGPEAYLTIGMQSVVVDGIEAQLVFKGNDMFAHMERLRFIPNQLSFKYLATGICHCWDFMGNAPCPCIE